MFKQTTTRLEMPIIKKLFKIGHSRAITIPKGWLQFYEKQEGKTIEKVAIQEVDGILRVSPIFQKENNRATDFVDPN